jgi:excinuclease UvrABC ATPase subunit
MTIRSFLGQFVKKRDDQRVLYTATQTAEERGKEWKRMEEVPFPKGGRCPNCGNDTFYEGPSGGLATNVECVKCHLRWNANNVGLSWQFIGFNRERQEVEDILTEEK